MVDLDINISNLLSAIKSIKLRERKNSQKVRLMFLLIYTHRKYELVFLLNKEEITAQKDVMCI